MIEIIDSPFDPHARLADYQRSLQSVGGYGAEASFTGYMRDHNDGERVTGMHLEYYPGMTERHLQSIADEAARRWELLEVLILHRVGDIAVGEAIVLVAAWSAHRADAFEACRFMMEDLKSRAPFWKKEQLDPGERWVQGNTPGYK
ncbi:molybdopterin synthase catalytic subunit [Methylohalomonas lacus]|uniref:Molybdopterin synthase catalytic subunit n=1 Tax=Methylohalomonas lacus TaxID=398773 RepID=A0AAE3HLG6_9GAMM|nr:molybdenum cofactor biosynthesis protein MoaE [Methylohalomonas lacus]MCS3902597.1 molybdopterin synthase catalytic subunit [Methylohalomonas lacus]